MDFIECVTKYKSRYGWKHKDIIKMAHPLGNSPGKRSYEENINLFTIFSALSKKRFLFSSI